jgi:hypothetical protein
MIQKQEEEIYTTDDRERLEIANEDRVVVIKEFFEELGTVIQAIATPQVFMVYFIGSNSSLSYINLAISFENSGIMPASQPHLLQMFIVEQKSMLHSNWTCRKVRLKRK